MQEIWTLCRIFKRSVSHRKQYTPDLRQLAAKRASTDKITKMRSLECDYSNQEAYINFGTNFGHYANDHRPVINNNASNDQRHHHHQVHVGLLNSPAAQPPRLSAPSSDFWNSPAANDFFTFENWDELGSVVKFAADSPMM